MEDTNGFYGDVVPSRIGAFRILTRIASGGMGTVYLAETTREDGSSLQVALKVLHGHLAQEDDVARRFVDEGRVGARIAHPNVVAVHDAGQIDGVSYLALEYIHGATLSALVRASLALRKPVPVAIATSIFLDVLAGLHAAHEVADAKGQSLGIVHRDVSPQNILVDLDGRAFVSDFGVARVKDAMSTTRTGTLIGKPGYMAPEQLTGMAIDARTDLYASGILFWECLTGRRLFNGVEDQIRGVVAQRVQPRIRSVRSDISEEIDALVADILEHEQSKRPQTAFDVSVRLLKSTSRASRSEVGAWVDVLAGHELAILKRRARGLPDDDDDDETVARPWSLVPAELVETLTERPGPELPQLIAPRAPPRVLPPPSLPPPSLPPPSLPPRSLERPSTAPPPALLESSTAVDAEPACQADAAALSPVRAVSETDPELHTVTLAQPVPPRRSVGYVLALLVAVLVASGAWLVRSDRTVSEVVPAPVQTPRSWSSATPELPELAPATSGHASERPVRSHPHRRR